MHLNSIAPCNRNSQRMRTVIANCLLQYPGRINIHNLKKMFQSLSLVHVWEDWIDGPGGRENPLSCAVRALVLCSSINLCAIGVKNCTDSGYTPLRVTTTYCADDSKTL
ncbi:hypothetical protein ACFX1W_034536 [Malus domestica]